MKNIHFKNAYVLTLCDNDKVQGEYQVRKDLDMITCENKIIFIGTKDEADEFLKNNKYSETDFVEYDCKGNLLMPSLKNMHAHSGMSFLRGISENETLSDWLKKSVFLYEKFLEPSDVYYFTALSILEYLSSGISMAYDMYFKMDAVAKAALDMDFRMRLVESITTENADKLMLSDKFYRYNHIGEFKESILMQNYEKRLQDDSDGVKYAEDKNIDLENYNFDLISYNLGMHSEYLNNRSTFNITSDLLHKCKCEFSVHNSETESEIINCKNKYGKTPTEMFEEFGLFDYGGYSYHSIHLNDKDLEILKKRNINIVACEASNLKLKSGFIDLKKYKNLGLNISLGTDGPASNDSLSMFREMYLATALQREVGNDNINSSDILNMACKNGVKNLYGGHLGELKVGNIADIILIDLHKANMWPLNNIVRNLVFSANESNVIMTMVDGKILYDKEKYILPKIKKCIFEMSELHNQILRITKNVFEKINIKE